MNSKANPQRQLIADFFTANNVKLVNYTIARLGNREESEDLVQEVFIKLLAFDGIIKEATIKSFAFTIATNKIKDVLRRRIYRHNVEENTKYEMELQHSDVERITEYHETLTIVNQSIKKLTPACAKVYCMSLFDDVAADDIAQKLNVSKRTVEAQLFASRKQMRSMLKAAM